VNESSLYPASCWSCPTKSGGATYLLYHRAGKVTVGVAVTPGHPGGCVEAETQEFAKGTWHASAKTGCATLNPGIRK
jgi:hypothetical protein